MGSDFANVMASGDPAVPIAVDRSASIGVGGETVDVANSIAVKDPITGFSTYIRLYATSPEERLKEIKDRIHGHQKICDENLSALHARIIDMELKDEVRCAMQRTKDGCEATRCQWTHTGSRGRCTYNTRSRDAERTRLMLKGGLSSDEKESLQRLEIIHRLQPQVEAQLEEMNRWCEKVPGQLKYLVGQLDKFRKQEIPTHDEERRNVYELEQLALYTTYRLVSNVVASLKRGKATIKGYIDEIEKFDSHIIGSLEALVKVINQERSVGTEELGLVLLDMAKFVRNVDAAIADFDKLGDVAKLTSIKEWEVKKVSRQLDLHESGGLRGLVSDATQWARGASAAPRYAPLYNGNYFRSFPAPKGRRATQRMRKVVKGKGRRRRGV